MTWVGQIAGSLAAGCHVVGPGRLVVVVGPSGAGKDTLIARARAACADDRRIVFPQRIVTRSATTHEEHDSMSEAAFDEAAADGAFAFWWGAHGLKYALPLSVETDVRAGRTVVCNVSRTIIDTLRRNYAQVSVVLVTAPEDVLAERLQQRARAADGSIEARVKRSASLADSFAADHVIENTGHPDEGAAALLAAIRASDLIAVL